VLCERQVPRYGTKFFRVYIPQVHDKQTDFCLFARKRLNKNKFRFRCAGTASKGPGTPLSNVPSASLDESFTASWTDAVYGGKVLMTPSADTKRFRLVASKSAGRVHFDIKQEARKQELSVRLNASVCQPVGCVPTTQQLTLFCAKATRFNFFRGRSTSVDGKSEVYRSNIQVS
jgi:hypothetical protein